MISTCTIAFFDDPGYGQSGFIKVWRVIAEPSQTGIAVCYHCGQGAD